MASDCHAVFKLQGCVPTLSVAPCGGWPLKESDLPVIFGILPAREVLAAPMRTCHSSAIYELSCAVRIPISRVRGASAAHWGISPQSDRFHRLHGETPQPTTWSLPALVQQCQPEIRASTNHTIVQHPVHYLSSHDLEDASRKRVPSISISKAARVLLITVTANGISSNGFASTSLYQLSHRQILRPRPSMTCPACRVWRVACISPTSMAIHQPIAFQWLVGSGLLETMPLSGTPGETAAGRRR